MTEPLDVSLRLRLAYEAGGAARAVADMEALRLKATQLGSGAGAGKLGQDIGKIAPAAQGARRNIADLTAAAAKLGTGDAGTKAAADLGKIAPAAVTAKRDILDLSAAAAKLGNTDLGANLRRDFDRLSVLVRSGHRDILHLGRAVDGLGTSAGPRALEREIDAVGRHADEARRKIDRMASASHGGVGPGRGAGGGRIGTMAEDAIQAIAPGAAMRFGGGVSGLAAGAAIYEIGRGLTYATRQAISFESAMSEVAKATNLDPEGLKEMERVILSTARNTGVAREELAKLVAQAGFAGVPSQDLARFATFGAKAAGAFEMSPEEAGDKLAKLRNVYALTQDGIENFADGINLLGDTTAAKERQIVDFLTRVGPAAQAFGLKPLQTAALGATMEATGMEPEVAGSAVNALMTHLSSADKQPKRFKDALKELHLSPRQLMAEVRADPLNAIFDVLDRINRLGANKAGIAAELTGMAHGPEIVTLAGQVDNFRAAVARVEDQTQRTGSVEKTFAIFSATNAAKIKRMNEEVGAFAVRLGERLAPAAAAAADAIARFFHNLNEGADRSDKAASIVEKIIKGIALTPDDKAAIDKDPELKASIDRRLKAEERAADYRQEAEDNRRAPGAPPPAKRPEAFGPPMPDHEALEGAARREANRQRDLDEVRELEERMKRGGTAPGERARLRDRIDRYKRTWHEAPEGVTFGAPRYVPKYAPDPPAAAPTPAPATPQIAPPERQGALEDPGLIRHAAFRYGGEVSAEGPNDLQGMIEAGTKSGVIAGMREVLELRGSGDRASAAGFQSASYDPDRDGGFGGGSGGSGGFGGGGFGGGAGRSGGFGGRGWGGGSGAVRHASIRYGGGHAEGGPSTPLGKTGSKFAGKAPAIMRGLMDRYGLTKEQAAGVVGNLAHESAGFTAYHEGGQAADRGGVGWAQWTGPRRRAFEAWTEQRGLNPTSDEASWRYLTEGDPETPKAIEAVKKTRDAHGAAVAFERSFERAGVKGYGSRFKFADQALALGPGDPQPTSAARTPFLDPAQRREAADMARRHAVPPPSETLSPRFSDGMTSASLRQPGAGPGGGGQAGHMAAAAPAVQHFYGNHDPAQTARYAMLEQNREIRRTQARALHGIGRVA